MSRFVPARRDVLLLAARSAGALMIPLALGGRAAAEPSEAPASYPRLGSSLARPDAEWRKQLTPIQYKILRQKGTEQAFTGEHWDRTQAGLYICAGCDAPLFHSETKFKSGTGWPSFYQPTHPARIRKAPDRSYGMNRDEVVCARCGGHQGHVFPDGPKPTGLRYCINSGSLRFIPGEGNPDAP